MANHIVVLGVFVADTTYRADRSPKRGETILGNRFTLGPGGKGSNQAVAAAKAGGKTHLITRLGRDTFADLAYETWRAAGVHPEVTVRPQETTGAANIFVEEASGENAIIICPGVAAGIAPEDLEAQRPLIETASVFLTQLEQPLAAAICGLKLARAAGVRTVLNPAPAAALPDLIFPLIDFITPNETEAEALTGISVRSLAGAEKAADSLLEKGVGTAVITLGAEGVYLKSRLESSVNGVHIPACHAGPVVETTGAGDAFNGGFAVGLTEGRSMVDAARFACATAGLSVTREGAAASMPTRAQIDQRFGSTSSG